MDTSERGAGDCCSASRPGLLPETPRLLSGRHSHAPPLPAPGRGIHRPQKSQVCHEAPVRDVCVERGRLTIDGGKEDGESKILILVLLGYICIPFHIT